jgi:hypothetical protein
MTKAAQIERELGGVAVTVVYDTDNRTFGSCSSRALIRLVFPPPDGAATT